MSPSIGLFFWTFFITMTLVALVYFLIKKKRNGEQKLLVIFPLIILVLITFNSCNKEFNHQAKTDLQILEEMGVNIKYDSLFKFKELIKNTTRPISFNSIKEARDFFQKSKKTLLN